MWALIRLVRATWLFGWILASYLFQMGLERVLGRERVRERWRGVHRRNARRMYRGFVRLHGVYIKLGQILSVMGTFLPRAYGEELEALQDTVPPQPYRKIARSFARAIGEPPTDVFAEFAREPIAAASLGQVHEARSHDGERLAVKILYPNVATIISVDLRVLGWALKVYRWFVPVRQLDRVHEQLEDMLMRETDLAHEADCIERMAKNFADDDDVLFPVVCREFTRKNVLTMSFMDGVKVNKLDALAELEVDPEAVAIKLVQIFYRQVFADRFFHADPHPGNFFVQRGPDGQPRIVVLDLGAASEVTTRLADGMLDVLTGTMTRDDDLVIKGIETMGFVAADGDRALLEQTTRKYFDKLLNLDISDFSKLRPDMAARAVDSQEKRAELRELMKSVEYPLGWFYVERAVVLMFGLSVQLAPKLNTLRIGFPFVMQFLAAQRQAAAAKPAAAANTATGDGGDGGDADPAAADTVDAARPPAAEPAEPPVVPSA